MLLSVPKKHSGKEITWILKTHQQYNHLHNTELGNSEGTSVLKNVIPQSKINIKIQLQTIDVRATLHKIISVCSLYISSHEQID